MKVALETKGLIKQYGRRRALDGLDLRVPAGSLFGLVGHNGAGKTTLLGIASGLIKPSGGHIDVLEGGAFSIEKHAGSVSVLPQDAGLPPYARVGELLQYYGALQGLGKPEVTQAAQALLEEVNLGDRWDAPVRSLSHGMFRRLTVAQALLGSPSLILLDEPMSGLDPHEVANMREVLRRRAGGQTILISSHILHELEHLCDEVAFVRQGKLERQDRMESVAGHHRVVQIVLDGKAAPELAELGSLVPGAECVWDAKKATLQVDFDPESTQVTELTAILLPALLQQGCGILEVHRGGGLEQEYLKQPE